MTTQGSETIASQRRWAGAELARAGNNCSHISRRSSSTAAPQCFPPSPRSSTAHNHFDGAQHTCTFPPPALPHPQVLPRTRSQGATTTPAFVAMTVPEDAVWHSAYAARMHKTLSCSVDPFNSSESPSPDPPSAQDYACLPPHVSQAPILHPGCHDNCSHTACTATTAQRSASASVSRGVPPRQRADLMSSGAYGLADPRNPLADVSLLKSSGVSVEAKRGPSQNGSSHATHGHVDACVRACVRDCVLEPAEASTPDVGAVHRALQPMPEASNGACSHDSGQPVKLCKRPRSLHLHGDDTDDSKLLQLRGAISSQKRQRCEDDFASVGQIDELVPACMAFMPAGSGELEDEGLERLEDSLVGNDVILEECKRQSHTLRSLFRKCMSRDRNGHECVSLEYPGQLQHCCTRACLSANAVAQVVGEHCLLLKPYQVAAMAYFASLMQRGVRGCVLASDAGLEAHAIVAAWCAMLQKSNTKPLPTVCRSSRERHLPAVIACSHDSVGSWMAALKKWAPSLTVAALDNAGTSREALLSLEAYCSELKDAQSSARGAKRGSGRAESQGRSCPFDVLLVTSEALDCHIVNLLHQCPWLLAVLDDASSIPRPRFKQWRQAISGAQLRIAMEAGAVHSDSSEALRSLLEVAHSPLMDCRQGNMLSLAPCASVAAEKREAHHMREALAPYVLQLSAACVVHQWAPKQYVQRSSKMTLEHAAVYRDHATQHAADVRNYDSAPSGSVASGVKQRASSSSPGGKDKIISAFKTLYQVAQHPLLGRAGPPQRPAATRAACASSCSEHVPSQARGSFEPTDTCSVQNVPAHDHNQEVQLQPEEVLQASKCGSLLHLLRSSGPSVVSSSFSAILDICTTLLKHAGIEVARLDCDCSEEECTAGASRFATGKVQVVLVQQQLALKHPTMDLSRAELCVFYDSGLSRSAEKALEACCLRIDKVAMTTFCRLVTLDSIDDSVAELQRRRQHQKLHASSTSSNMSSSSGAHSASDYPVDYNELLSNAVRSEVLRHIAQDTEQNLNTVNRNT